MTDIVDVLKEGKAFSIVKDGKALSVTDLENMTALNLNTLPPDGVRITLYGQPVKIWNEFGMAAFSWRGANSEVKWDYPSLALLDDLYSLSEATNVRY